MTTVFITTTGASSFPDPGNWNPVNKVECIGSGGKGANSAPAPLLREAGAEPRGSYTVFIGGGGGAYAYRNNCVPLSWPVNCVIAAGGARLQGQANIGTCFGQTTSGATYQTTQSVDAMSGEGGGGAGAIGGSGGSAPWPAGNVGGAGGYMGGTTTNGYGGGGAGGPHGAGSTAAANTTGAAGDGGNAPAQATLGAAGNMHACWDATHGAGGGGAATNDNGGTGGAGGGYGGGGASANGTNRLNPGQGAPGIIVLTYVPFNPPSGRAMIIA